MSDLVVEQLNEGIAYIVAPGEDGESAKVATVYRMADGWHSKLAAEHTRHAWSGPFDSPEETLADLSRSQLKRTS